MCKCMCVYVCINISVCIQKVLIFVCKRSSWCLYSSFSCWLIYFPTDVCLKFLLSLQRIPISGIRDREFESETTRRALKTTTKLKSI